MSMELNVEITDSLDGLADRGVRAIARATGILAEQLRTRDIPEEAPTGATGALARDWRQRQDSPLERIVYPGPEAFYAHIVAGGRAEVTPDGADALTIEGRFAAHAAPTAGNPFHERALRRTQQSTDDAIAQALAAEGLG